MKKLAKARIWLTAAAVFCLLALMAMSAWGVNHQFTDGLILWMKLAGAAGVAALVTNVVLAVAAVSRKSENGGAPKGKD